MPQPPPLYTAIPPMHRLSGWAGLAPGWHNGNASLSTGEWREAKFETKFKGSHFAIDPSKL